MTMRSTVFTSRGNKLDTDITEQAKKQALAAEFQTGVKKEGCKNLPVRVPGVLSTIHNSSEQHHLNSKVKTFSSSHSPAVRPGQTLAVRKGQEENWVNLGDLELPLAKQMGAEGTPVKSKSLFGQASHNHLGRMDPVASNGSKQPRKAGPVGGVTVAGVPSPEHGSDAKRRNMIKGIGHATAQTSCFRQILLLQLELIEQQQQQLQNKNKEIDDLKAEKEMLTARIERMERRLQIVRKDGAESRTSQTRRKETAETVSPESTGQPEGQSQTPKPMTSGRGGKSLKRRFLFQESSTAGSTCGQCKTPPPNEDQALKEENQEEEISEFKSHESSIVQSEELPYLATTDMYLCCWHQPPPSPWHEPESPVQDDTVTVPSWRERIVEPLEEIKATDIPESLDDGVFLKRHSKQELNEKRRKRWDIQRIREQRMFQRLQQRMERRKVTLESEPELLSFYPETEDVESIMITPHLPVVAFGRPLPSLQQQSFDIPWLQERSRCRQELSKKKTPHRTCRK